jgi:hypothetical protein
MTPRKRCCRARVPATRRGQRYDDLAPGAHARQGVAGDGPALSPWPTYTIEFF